MISLVACAWFAAVPIPVEENAPGPPRECLRSDTLGREIADKIWGVALLGEIQPPACIDQAAKPEVTCGDEGCVVRPGKPNKTMTLSPAEGKQQRVPLHRRRSSTNQPCADTFVSKRPIVRFSLLGPSTRALQLRLTRSDLARLALYIRAPDGRWYCDQLDEQTDRSLVVTVENPPLGAWQIWIGAVTEWWIEGTPGGLLASEYPPTMELSLSASDPPN